jgi:hypothetical protein
MIITMHPQCIGRGHRLLALKDFLITLFNIPESDLLPACYVRNGVQENSWPPIDAG